MEKTKQIKIPKKHNTPTLFTEKIQPLRTTKGDIARLISEKYLNDEEIKKIDNLLLNEALNYHKQGGDKAFFEKLKIDEKYNKEKHISQTIEDEVNNFINKTETGIISKYTKKSREKSEQLRKDYSTNSEAQNRYQETLKNKGKTKNNIIKHEDVFDNIEQKYPAKLEGLSQANSIEETKKEIIDKNQDDLSVLKSPNIINTKHISPHPPQKKEITQEEKLFKEEHEIKIQLNALPQKSRAVIENINNLEKQKERIENFITPLITKEKEIEEEEQVIAEREQNAESSSAVRVLEEKRWVLEDRRRDLEQKRWKADQTIIKITDEIKKETTEKNHIIDEQAYLEQKLVFIERKKHAITAKHDLKIFKQKLQIFEKEKEPIELKWIALSENKRKIAQEIATLERSEAIEEEQISEIEIKERSAEEASEMHKYESNRWQHEEKHRKIEKHRWKLEDENEKITIFLKKLKDEYQTLLKEEETTEKKIEELEIIIVESKEQ